MLTKLNTKPFNFLAQKVLETTVVVVVVVFFFFLFETVAVDNFGDKLFIFH